MPGEACHFPFLRTYKPMLKRARGTDSYQDVRALLKLWLHCRHITELLKSQNARLYQAAHERDCLYTLASLEDGSREFPIE